MQSDAAIEVRICRLLTEARNSCTHFSGELVMGIIALNPG
jgi:hypothetical protein